VIPEAAERIFRFWDRDGSQVRVRGHGMGPAIARHLARAMVGEFVLALPTEPTSRPQPTDGAPAQPATNVNRPSTRLA
jgi:hypothetical protein